MENILNTPKWDYTAVSKLHVTCFAKDMGFHLKERTDGTLFVFGPVQAEKLAVLQYAPHPAQPGYYRPAKLTSPKPKP